MCQNVVVAYPIDISKTKTANKGPLSSPPRTLTFLRSLGSRHYDDDDIAEPLIEWPSDGGGVGRIRMVRILWYVVFGEMDGAPFSDPAIFENWSFLTRERERERGRLQ